MEVYQVIKDCTISFLREGRDVGFALYVGDYFFIKSNACWVKDGQYSIWKSKDLLLKIYYKKIIDLDGNKDWVWENDINIADPFLNDRIPVRGAQGVDPIWGAPICKNVTTQWIRDQKLEELL